MGIDSSGDLSDVRESHQIIRRTYEAKSVLQVGARRNDKDNVQDIGFQISDEVILKHKFHFYEQWLVFFTTLITACAFYAVVVVLWKKHRNRGLDIVILKFAALCFLIYRSAIAFRFTPTYSHEYLFLPNDSWHKLANIFLLIEYCSLVIYLSRLPKVYEGYLRAFGICIILILQEKDSFSY